MTWHRLDEELPPERVRYDGESVIRWKSADEGWQALEPEEYKDCRWAIVRRPEE